MFFKLRKTIKKFQKIAFLDSRLSEIVEEIIYSREKSKKCVKIFLRIFLRFINYTVFDQHPPKFKDFFPTCGVIMVPKRSRIKSDPLYAILISNKFRHNFIIEFFFVLVSYIYLRFFFLIFIFFKF